MWSKLEEGGKAGEEEAEKEGKKRKRRGGWKGGKDALGQLLPFWDRTWPNVVDGITRTLTISIACFLAPD